MSCKTARAELVLAFYGDLPPGRRRELDAHVAECSACASERAALGRVLEGLTAATVFPREAEVDWSRPLTCQAVRADLSAYLGGAREAAGDGDLPAHLARCPDCAAESAAISATLTAVRGAFPEEARVDWDAFARDTARLARQAGGGSAEEAPGGGIASFPAPPGLLRRVLPVAASIAAALAIGYLTLQIPGLLGPGGEPPAPLRATGDGPGPAPGVAAAPADTPRAALDIPSAAPDTAAPGSAGGEASAPGEAAPDAPVLVASDEMLRRTRLEMAKSDAARYLADSRNLLMSFTELPVPCEGENVDISVEREISNRLLRRKQFLDRDLQDVEVARARRVANEVESLLSEIALLDNCVPPARVQEIRDLVGQRQLMMRIEMLTDELGPARGGRA